jgi:hypothetical protein
MDSRRMISIAVPTMRSWVEERTRPRVSVSAPPPKLFGENRWRDAAMGPRDRRGRRALHVRARALPGVRWRQPFR